MRYQCLVLDHDDTVVNSTATIHFPSFLEFIAKVRPGVTYTLEQYFRENFDPGIMELFVDTLHFTQQELQDEFAFWQSYVKTRVPHVYDGMREIIEAHRAQGGLVCVVSHSTSETIVRDYRENGLPQPDLIYGWELPVEMRKPNPWALERIMERFSLAPSELLMVDDLRPGYEMARACGVDFAAAGWANDIPEIEGFMRKNCDYYCKRVSDLAKILEEA